MLSLCPLYPKEPFRTPPELNDIYRAIKVANYYGATGAEHYSRFPLPDLGQGRVVQDGIILNKITAERYVFHTELNCLGLYFYKQAVGEEYGNPSLRGGVSMKMIEMGDIFCRLDQFLDSGNEYYEQLGCRGFLHFRMNLDHIEDYRLFAEARRDRSDISLDPEVSYEETVLAGSLSSEKSRLILRVAQQVGWAFGWNITQEILDHCYTLYRQRR